MLEAHWKTLAVIGTIHFNFLHLFFPFREKIEQLYPQTGIVAVIVQGLMAQLSQGTEAEEVGGNAWRELCGVRRVQWEKVLKTKLEDAIKLFNDDYRKGFQMMQARSPAHLFCPP